MAEKNESQDTGAEASGSDVDPAAIALALGGASREDAGAFLKKQGALIDDQRHHLREQFKQLRLAIWEKRLGMLLRFATMVIGLAVAAALGLLVRDATQAQGLVIEAFSVPPDLAARGLTGEVVATRFLDQFKAMQAATVSERTADTYQYNWGSELKVEIPETGLTFGELDKFLRDRFGSASHVTGEVVRTASGIAVTARLGDAPPKSFAGPESDFDSLARQAAEAVYRGSQPYRYAQYVAAQGRTAEALAVISDLAISGPPGERGWAYTEWGTLDMNGHGDLPAAIRHCLKGRAVGDASTVAAEICLTNAQVWSGHDEAALDIAPELAKSAQVRTPGVTEDYFENNKIVSVAYLEYVTGDLLRSAEDFTRAESAPDFNGSVQMMPAMAAMTYAQDHDPATAARIMTGLEHGADTDFLRADALYALLGLPAYWIAADRGDWSAALSHARAADVWLAAREKDDLELGPLLGRLRPVWIEPLMALAMTQKGDAAAGAALAATTPGDCYLCLRIRGQIATAGKNWQQASDWFARAVAAASSIPFAYADWGRMLLAKGDADAAIAKFTLANRKGPHFADPLEMWGEALMAKNRSDLALAKFTEADKYAPNWGHLHLKWGEALSYAGRKDEARAQYRIASRLDLGAADKSELARQMRG
jgi:tetratricopeptide (TPR) repeat protein